MPEEPSGTPLDWFTAKVLLAFHGHKAWNAYARREPVHTLRWQGIEEKIPTPVH